MMDWVRYRVAFYGSTPAYADVLRLHGWDDLHETLRVMARAGRWDEMAARVPDDVVRTFAAVGSYGEITERVRERFGGLVDGTSILFPDDTPEGIQRELVRDVQALPAAFRGFDTKW
jgi:alkanesulfonate monooxygenase SsuD/methylene tetrahydromethanopterin reductase-like flavin-dependent oxidoreductase (luciferase family)